MSRSKPNVGISTPYNIYPGSEFKEASGELELAEHNCDVILQTAETMIRRSLPFHDLRNPSGMIDPLRDLVGKLKTIYSFIRRDLRLKYSIDIQGRVASEKQDRPTVGPRSFDNQQTICPLVLFFRIISQGLNAYRISVAADSDWGPIRPLYTLLNTLQKNIGSSKTNQGMYLWPALIGCIMFQEHESVFAIASSSARYYHLEGLTRLAREVRNSHMERLENHVSPELRLDVQRMKRLCDEARRNRQQHPFQQEGNRARVPGVGATFSPGSGYMPACFLDHFRFAMQRPNTAQQEERTRPLGRRQLYPVDNCAEWELWMIRISNYGAGSMSDGQLRTPPPVAACGTFPARKPQAQSAAPLRSWNTAAPGVGPWAPPVENRPPQSMGGGYNPPKSHDEEEESGCCVLM